ncbi:MFS transporter [Kitasatospora sp. McL0602]|uniref:MFS transporter n=1 Tax=Kitasatospora sp. McL0602 TaxID=3439530 RepID=UPI003F8AE3D5
MTTEAGRRFALLWTASAISCVGDGVLLTAGPLLVLSLNSDPKVVATAEVAVTLPYLLLGIFGGVVVDRMERRRLMVGLDLARGLLLAVVVASLLIGVAQIPVLLVALFILSTADTVFRTAAQTVLPSIVPKDALVRANSRLMSAETIGTQFFGPALGGLLFAASVTLPFLVDGISFAGSGLLVLFALPMAARSLGRKGAGAADGPAGAGAGQPKEARPGILKEAAEGVRWMWGQGTLRFLAATSAVINFFTGATTAIMVIYAHRVLHLSGSGYGLVIACGAFGGLAAGLVAGKVAKKVGIKGALALAVGLQAVGQAVLFVASDRVLTVLALSSASYAQIQFSSVSVALRQAQIPSALLGRVTSVYRMMAWGSVPLGAMVAGLVVAWVGLRVTFAVGAVLLTVQVFRVLVRNSGFELDESEPVVLPVEEPQESS